MRQYELTVLIHPDLEMNLQPALDKVAKIVEDAGGKITKEVNEGKKHLAYKVAGQDFAIYYYYELDLPSGKEGNKDAARKVASGLDLADEVIRHLLVTVDENRIKMEAKRRERKSASADAEAEAEADADASADADKAGESSDAENSKKVESKN